MTLRHVDSMALYNSMAEAVASGKWTATSSAGGGEALRAAGRNTGAYSLLCPSGGRGFQRDFSTESWVGANVGIIVGFAMKPVGSFTASPAAQQIELFDKNTNTSGWMINVDSATVLSLHLGTGTAGTWGSSVATTACSTSTWDYHEIKVLPGGTNGAASRVIWKKNGTQVYDSGAGAVDIKSSTMNQLNLGQSFSAGNNASSYFTDLYVCDTIGGNADFLGDTRIECLLPSDEGHRQDLTAAVQNLLTPDQYGLEGSMPWVLDPTVLGGSGGSVARSSLRAYSGTYSLRIAQGSTTSSATTGSDAGSQGIPVLPSTTYTLAWRFYNESASLLTPTFRVRSLSNSGGAVGTDSSYSPSSSYTANTWQTDSFTFTTASSARFIQIYIGLPNQAGALMYVDEIGVYPGSTAYWQAPGKWGNVADLPKDDDSGYIRSGVDGAVQTFQMGDLNSASGSVVGVVVNPWARAENTGTRQLQPAFVGTGGNTESSFVGVWSSFVNSAGNVSFDASGKGLQEGDELFFVLNASDISALNLPSDLTVISNDLHLVPYLPSDLYLVHKTVKPRDLIRNFYFSTGSSFYALIAFAYRGVSYASVSVTDGLQDSITTPAVTPTAASTVVNLYLQDSNGYGFSASYSGAPSGTTLRGSGNDGTTAFLLTDEQVAASVAAGSHAKSTGIGGTSVNGGPPASYAWSIVLNGLVTYVGTTASAGTLNNDLAYHLVPLVVESNPITTAAWTIADVNAIEAGVKLN